MGSLSSTVIHVHVHILVLIRIRISIPQRSKAQRSCHGAYMHWQKERATCDGVTRKNVESSDTSTDSISLFPFLTAWYELDSKTHAERVQITISTNFIDCKTPLTDQCLLYVCMCMCMCMCALASIDVRIQQNKNTKQKKL